MTRTALLGLLVLLTLVVSACGERPEPTGPAVKLYPVTITPANGEGPAVTLSHAPARVGACTPAASSLVTALEHGADGRPKILDVDCSGQGGAGSQLADFHPDLVIAAGSSPHTSAPVYAISATSVRDAEQVITDVGALLGRPLQARAMVVNIESQARDVRHKVETLRRVTTFVDTGFYITVPSQSLTGEIVSDAGGENVAGANPGAGPYDLGLLARRNPAFYLATSDSGVTLKDVRKNPRTKHLRAVRSGHFGIVPSSYLQPGPLIGDGILAVAKLLHPDAFR